MNKDLNPDDLLQLIIFLRDHLALFHLNECYSWTNVGWTNAGNLSRDMEFYYSFDNSISLHNADAYFLLQPQHLVLMDNSINNSCDNGNFRIFGFNYCINKLNDPDGAAYQTYRRLLSNVIGKPIYSDPSTARLLVDIERDRHFNAKECDTSSFCAIIQILLGAYRILSSSAAADSTYINPKSRKIVNNIAEYLISHPQSDEKLEEIAARFGLNHRYINRMFKLIYGMPIQKYHCIARIKQAKRMLSSTDMTMVEIAVSLNFTNSQYFSYVFKKETGTTPNEYRKLAKGIYTV